LCGCSSVG